MDRLGDTGTVDIERRTDGPGLADRISKRFPRRMTPARRRLLFAFAVLALMLGLCAPLFSDPIARDAPAAENGALSFARWGALATPVELKGRWHLRWEGGPGPVRPGTVLPIAVPGGWKGLTAADGTVLPGSGLARYELTVAGLAPGRYILHVPVIFAANRVFLNGRLMSGFGRLGATADTTRYYIRSHEIPFDADGSPIALAIEVAAFHHRDTGPIDAPVLGEAVPMRRWIAVQWAKDFLFQTSLLLLAATTLMGFLYRRQDRASLYLAVAALCSIPGSAVIGYDNILLLAIPSLGYPTMLAWQYIGTNLALVFFLAYARALYPRETPRRLYLSVQGVTFALIAAQAISFVISGPRLASEVAIVWPAALLATFCTVIAIVAHAARRSRDGAAVFLLGIVVFTVFQTNAALVWTGFVGPDFLLGATAVSVGMLVLLFSHFIVIAERWSLAIVAAERNSGDLRELLEVSSAVVSEVHLETLLARIVDVTSRMLSADRATLLLHDTKTGELWSLVAEGLGSRQIRFSSTAGLAGHAFTTGTPLSVTDAYKDPRFNPEVDFVTGYRTRSVLAMPIAARDGRRLGVLQVLNARDGPGFSANATARMTAFAAQAAIAIENATLFSEIVESRNYNESILRSMSNGVVTLDRETGIGRINAAARRILGVAGDGLDEIDARALLGQCNPALIGEIDGVSATGEPKLLLDLDVVTAAGETVALNLSIVPLHTEGEVLGVLVLIEDISEGKRLQGAMRRFMTQEVVDQVLGRRDELMFGTACTASVVFADIRDFTSMAEALSARDTVDMLNEAFTEFVEAVAAHNGVLDKFIGDAVMAVYGAPLPTGHDATNAVESAVQMLRMLGMLNQRRCERGLPPLKLGIGVSTGEVVAGTIGSPKRMDYTVIGDSVNLAARLQDLTKAYGVEILVCEATAAAVSGRYRLRELDMIQVRGRQRPETIFQILSDDAGVRPLAPDLIDAYQRGRALLGKRAWADAVRTFEEALAIDPGDRPTRIMLDRARVLAATPPPSDWDGVWSRIVGA